MSEAKEGAMNETGIELFGTLVLVEHLPNVKAGGIYTVRSKADSEVREIRAKFGRVVAVGPGAKNGRGEFVEVRHIPGQHVIYMPGTASEMMDQRGRTLEAVHTEHIMGRALWLDQSDESSQDRRLAAS